MRVPRHSAGSRGLGTLGLGLHSSDTMSGRRVSTGRGMTPVTPVERVWLGDLPMSLDWESKLSKLPPPPPPPPRVEPGVVSRECDIFGGHGMFNDMGAVAFAVAIFGMLPITFRSPHHISTHPFRSSLLYCVLVTLALVWSGCRMVQARVDILFVQRYSASTKSFYTSIMCLVHGAGVILLPLLWVEARHMRRNQELYASLMANFGRVRRRCPYARALAWLFVTVGLLLSPAGVYLWLVVVAAEGSHWSHILIHNHVILLEFFVTTMITCQFYSVATFANDLSRTFAQELSQPYPSAQRVAAYRRAWLKLRDVAQGLVAMPMTATYLLLFFLLMMTLNTYLAIVCLLEGQHNIGMLIFAVGWHFFALMMLLCDAGYRAAEAVRTGFQQPLESFCSGRSVGEAAMEEINTFREIVSATPIIVSTAGFWDIDRHTITSLMAAAVSYLIVLIQFRTPREYSGDELRNQSTVEKTTIVN